MKEMNNLELLRKIEGYLLANKDRGLNQDQILECLDILKNAQSEITLPTINPTTSYPPYTPYPPYTTCGALNNN